MAFKKTVGMRYLEQQKVAKPVQQEVHMGRCGLMSCQKCGVFARLIYDMKNVDLSQREFLAIISVCTDRMMAYSDLQQS